MIAMALCLGGGILTASRAQQGPDRKGALIETKGTVVPGRTVAISPRFDGLLTKIHFTPGQFVNKGALLFEFDSESYRLCLEKDRAKLKRAEAQLRLAEVLLDNKRKLQARNVTCEMQVKEAEAARDTAAADVAEARAALELAETAVRDMKLYAPISGIISRPFMMEGAFITKASRQPSTLAHITQQDTISVVSRVPAGEVWWSGQQSKEGQEVSLILPDGSKYSHAGKIAGGGYELVPETQTAEIIFEFPNPHDLLRPGQTVTLQFGGIRGGALASPIRSVDLHCEGHGSSCSH